MSAFGGSAARSGGGHFGDRLGAQPIDTRSARGSILERKLTPNPRFAHVAGRLDTGSTVPKVKLLSARAYLKRKDESFYRISAAQLAELLAEQQEKQLPSPPHGGGSTADGPSSGGGPQLSPVKGYQPVLVQYAETDTPTNEQPYLVVDVREAREFVQVLPHKCTTSRKTHKVSAHAICTRGFDQSPRMRATTCVSLGTWGLAW
jgi:hypothetical protein